MDRKAYNFKIYNSFAMNKAITKFRSRKNGSSTIVSNSWAEIMWIISI